MFRFNKKNTLKEIYLSHRGKVADKWESYLDIYEDEFAKYRQTTSPILEIGVQNCGSLEVWAKYFSKSRQIIGNDILEDLRKTSFDDKRINLKICDSKELNSNFSDSYDSPIIIIDDASHQSSDIIKTFMSMFPLLLDGGLYVVEDLCCAYWKGFNKGVKVSSMSFLKTMADIVNYEHWERKQKIRCFFGDIGLVEFEDILKITDLIKSVKFYNSVCLIQKCAKGSSSQIGKRVVVGDLMPLGFKAKNGQDIKELKVTKRNFEFDDTDLHQ